MYRHNSKARKTWCQKDVDWKIHRRLREDRMSLCPNQALLFYI